MMEEIWKTIEGYPNYMVSNLGRVKSLSNNKTRREKILKSCKDGDGYLQLCLCKEGKVKRYFVHRLVAQTFLPNHDNLPQINHIDEDKANNMVWVNEDGSIDYNKSNLEWCDRSYNINYGNRNEIVAKYNSKPILQFSKTGEFIKKWNSIMQIERELGFGKSSICSCCKGRRKSAHNYKWGYEKDYERIQFKVFDLEMYEKKKKVA